MKFFRVKMTDTVGGQSFMFAMSYAATDAREAVKLAINEYACKPVDIQPIEYIDFINAYFNCKA